MSYRQSNSYISSRKSGYGNSSSQYTGDHTSKRSSSSSWEDASQTQNYNDSHRKSSFWRIVLNQRCYYIAGLLLNALLLSFYTVQTFTPHVPCRTLTGSNVTKGFEFAFKLGFYAAAADFINAAFFEFYIRQRTHIEIQNFGQVTKTTQALETVYAVMEWVFRAIYILLTILQAIIRNSETGDYCIN